ncbi:hypothetical protein ES705_49775 [subsurface metagenome]
MSLKYFIILFIFSLFSFTGSAREYKKHYEKTWEVSLGTGFYATAAELGFGRSISRKSVIGLDLGYYDWLYLENITYSFGVYYNHFTYDDCTQKKGNWYLALFGNIKSTKYKDNPAYINWLSILNLSIGKDFTLIENLKIYSCLGFLWEYIFKIKENPSYTRSQSSEVFFPMDGSIKFDFKLGLIKYF